MKQYYVCWVDDEYQTFVDSYKGTFDLIKLDYSVEFDIDEHVDTDNFDTIARNIGDELICLIDYNLKKSNGDGIDGHEVIGMIREYNKNCKIIFYSSKATQAELEELIEKYDGITCTLRENLRDIFIDIASA